MYLVKEQLLPLFGDSDTTRVELLLEHRLFDMTGFGENRTALRHVASLMGVTITRAREIIKSRIRKFRSNFMLLQRSQAILEKHRVTINEKEGRAIEIAGDIDSLDLSTRTRNCLAQEGIKTLKQLVHYQERELLLLPNFGRKSFNEIRDILVKRGLTLNVCNRGRYENPCTCFSGGK